jgi:hypothetical protein
MRKQIRAILSEKQSKLSLYGKKIKKSQIANGVIPKLFLGAHQKQNAGSKQLLIAFQGRLVVRQQLQAVSRRHPDQPVGRRVPTERGKEEGRLQALQAGMDGTDC